MATIAEMIADARPRMVKRMLAEGEWTGMSGNVESCVDNMVGNPVHFIPFGGFIAIRI